MLYLICLRSKKCKEYSFRGSYWNYFLACDFLESLLVAEQWQQDTMKSLPAAWCIGQSQARSFLMLHIKQTDIRDVSIFLSNSQKESKKTHTLQNVTLYNEDIKLVG